MKRRILPHLPAILGLALLLIAAGCSEKVSSGKDWQVTNDPDNFQLQVTGLRNYSEFLQYTWTNTGTTVSVNQACSITGGDATLKIVDAAGTPVYGLSLKYNGTYPSATGTPGSWGIVVRLTKTDGTLNFRVQKKQP